MDFLISVVSPTTGVTVASSQGVEGNCPSGGDYLLGTGWSNSGLEAVLSISPTILQDLTLTRKWLNPSPVDSASVVVTGMISSDARFLAGDLSVRLEQWDAATVTTCTVTLRSRATLGLLATPGDPCLSTFPFYLPPFIYPNLRSTPSAIAQRVPARAPLRRTRSRGNEFGRVIQVN